jgi:hemerythrin
MLREAWQVNPEVIHDFLKKHVANMPRTMLRYTIEKMSEQDRKRYMAK